MELLPFIFVTILAWRAARQSFKVSYYEQKLINHNIEDSVKDMDWWKLWMN